MIKTLIIEYHDLTASLLTKLLKRIEGIEVIGTSKLDKAVKIARHIQPDLIIVEVVSPDMIGLSVVERLKNLLTPANILVLTQQEQTIFLTQALKIGVKGYLTKRCDFTELVQAIHILQSGKNYISPLLAEKLALEVVSNAQNLINQLSEREFQILLMLVHGKRLREIANLLCISEKTAASYHVRILEKLRVPSDSALVQFVYNHGLLEFIA